MCVYLYNQTAKNTATMATRSSYGRTRKKPARYNIEDNEEEFIVEFKNENCTEEGNPDYFKLCTKCLCYYCCLC